MKVFGAIVMFTLLVDGYCAGSHCHWGPSFWCQSEENAKDCQKTQYCQDNVWKSDVNVDVEGIECTICELLVKLLEKEVLDNDTEAQAEAALMEMCDSIGVLKDECESFVKKYFDQIWNLVVKNALDPETLCTDIQACSSKRLARPAAAKMVKKVGGIECSICKEVVEQLVKIVAANATEAEAKAEIKKVCPYLGGFAPECKELIDVYFDDIWKFILQNETSEEICDLLKICTPKERIQTKPALKATPCDLCNLAVSFVKPFVDSNSTEKEVKDALDMACKLLPGSAGTECSSLMDQYFDVIWALVKEEVDSGEICKQIGLCNSTKLYTNSKMNKVGKPALKATSCDICNLAVSFVKPYVDSNSTEKEVKAALETVCGLLPGSAGTECTSLMDQYFDVIWALLKEEVDSGDICKQIGLCNSTKLYTNPKMNKVGKPALKAMSCDLCNLAVSFLKPYVDSNSTEAEVKAALDTACGLLPGSIGTECTTFVKSYFGLIWDLVKSEVDGGQICNQLGFCNGTKSLKKITSFKMSPSSVVCDECTEVAKVIESHLGNTTEGAVRSVIEDLCALLGKNCTEFATSYFHLIWQILQNEMGTGVICDQLGLCSSGIKSIQPRVKVTEDGLCEACKLVVSFLKPFVDSSSTESEIESAIKNMCADAASLKDECESLVDQYFPMIWKLISSYVDDDQICEEIKACTSASKKVGVAPSTVTQNTKSDKVGGFLCPICEKVMEMLESKIITNATVKDIENLLKDACGELPSALKNECEVFVDEYSDEIIKAILDGVGPKLVCAVIGLCAVEEEKVAQFQFQGNTECDVCKEIVKLAEAEMSSHEESAAEVLEKVCVLLPSGIQNECDNFVKTFAPQLIELLEKMMDSQDLCTEIKLCAKKGSMLMEPWLKLASTKKY